MKLVREQLHDFTLRINGEHGQETVGVGAHMKLDALAFDVAALIVDGAEFDLQLAGSTCSLPVRFSSSRTATRVWPKSGLSLAGIGGLATSAGHPR